MPETRLSSVGVQTLAEGKADTNALLSSVSVQALVAGSSATNVRLSALHVQVLAEPPPPTIPAKFVTKYGTGTLSADDQRLTAVDSSVTNAKVDIARDPVDGGKYYFEIAFAAGGDVCAFYIADETYDLAAMGSGPTDAQSVVWVTQNGFFGYFGANDIDFAGSGGENGTTQRFAFALDFDVSPPKVYIRRPNDGTSWRYSGNPEAGTGGKAFVNATPGPITPGVYLSGASGHFGQIYTRDADFTNPVPAGFVGWAEGANAVAPEVLLSAAFTDDGGLSATPTITEPVEPPDEVLLSASFVDDGGLSAAITTNKPQKLLAVNFRDESTLAVTMTTRAPIPYELLSASFTDDAGLSASITTTPPDRVMSANFQDDGGLSVKMSVVPVGGPFFFQWADEGEEFNSGKAVVGEEVFSFQVTQNEGDFANASVVIRNPRVGLLAAGRKRWVWMSYKYLGKLWPIFYGRVVGLPNNIFDELVTLELVARPHDFVEQKEALAESLRVLPFFDPVFIDPDSWIDPDTVLEGRTANWHVDRITHEVTISDIITPEDGVIEFTEDDYFFDNLQVTMADAPLRSVTIQSTLPWTLQTTQFFDITEYIRPFFGGNPDNYQLISSFTFSGLSQDWPKQGSKIGDGWEVLFGELADLSFTNVPEIKIGAPFDESTIPQAVPAGSIVYPPVITDGEYHSGEDAGFNINLEQVVVPIGYGKPKLVVQLTAGRDMGQFVSFTMKTDVQDVLTLAPDADNKIVTVNANQLTDISYWGDYPLKDNRARDYIRTDRGGQSLKHLMLVARAHLVAGTRVVQTSFQTDFFRGLDVTLRRAALIHNPRLPGGQALGKITGYTLSLDGESGEALCTITMASAVGRGGSYVDTSGDPSYIEDDYIDPSMYERFNKITALPAGDVTYTIGEWAKFDDGVDFRALNVNNIVKSFVVQNTAEQQRAVLAGYEGADQATISAVLQNIPTLASIELIPMSGGPFLGNEPLVVSDLVVPKQIDLEAPSQ